jgi:hypothetical protein
MNLEDQDELPLRDQICLAGLVDQLRDLAHRFVHDHSLELAVHHESEEQSQGANHQPAHQQRATRDVSKELHLG